MIRKGSRAAFSARALAVLVVGALLALWGGGCERDADGSDAAATRASSMDADDYIAHVAALTVALEEGRTGDAAMQRAIELGSAGHSREDVEAFATGLRSRPEEWVEIEQEVDRRIAELRETARRAGG